MARSKVDEEALDYAGELRKWYKEKLRDPKAVPPPLPRFLGVDFNLGGRRPHADSIERMVKDGHFNAVRVVVFHEKHGDRYYLVREQEDFARIALGLVKERKEMGFYGYHPGDHRFKEDDPPAQPKTSIAAAAGMDEPIQEQVREMWKRYDAAVADRAEAKVRKALLEKALAGDAFSAVRFLCGGRKCEYEEFEVIVPEVMEA